MVNMLIKALNIYKGSVALASLTPHLTVHR